MIRALPTPDRSDSDVQLGSLVALPLGHANAVVRPSRSVDDEESGPSLLDASLYQPRLLVVGAVLFGLLGLLVVAAKWSSYHASARVILRDPWEADIGATDRPVGGDFQRFVRSQARFMQTDEVLSVAAEQADVSKDELAAGLVAQASTSGDFVEVLVGASSPRDAGLRLDAVLAAYSMARHDAVERESSLLLASIQDEVERVGADANSELSLRATNLRIAVAAYDDGVSFVEQSPAMADLGLREKLGIPMAAALAGAGLAAVVAWIRANRHPRVRDPEALAEQRGLPFLGVVATTDGQQSAPADRVSAEATLLALAGSLRRTPPRSVDRAYVVVLAAASAATPTLEVSHVLARATASHGAIARVVDAYGTSGPTEGIDVKSELDGPPCDLLLFACGTPLHDFSALRLARDADAIVVVVAEGADANEVAQGLTFFENVGHFPSALIATKHTKVGR